MGLVAAAASLWMLFSLFLMLPSLGAPRELQRTVTVLLGVQFVLLVGSGYGRGAAYVLATQDVPALTLALLVTAVAYGLTGGNGGAPDRK